ncbi:hypothetical protein PhCBS80983_g05575 [Powellomyces hirtus]|uniref:Uridylate kinase n=1 Tax=Powellomyces hirtus TaxID=109895 RepID=A0A507DVZ8_9FUNG|nr:hypothetical protein PhCBS80983_g05575 [Powellomyces hirtus]
MSALLAARRAPAAANALRLSGYARRQLQSVQIRKAHTQPPKADVPPTFYPRMTAAPALLWTAAALGVGVFWYKEVEERFGAEGASPSPLVGDAKKKTAELLEAGKAKAQGLADEARDKASSAKDQANEVAENVKANAASAQKQASDKVASVKDSADEKVGELKGKAESAKQAATDKLKDAKQSAEEKAGQVKEKAAGLKQSATDRAKALKDIAEEKIDAAKSKAEDVKKAAADKAESVKKAVKDKVDAGKEKAEDVKQAGADKAKSVKKDAEDKVEDVKKAAKGKADELKDKSELVKQDAKEKVDDAKETLKSKAKAAAEEAKSQGADIKEKAQAGAQVVQAKVSETLDLEPLADDTTVVFVLGGPGAGKGTQCANLVRDYGFVHLSAGDLLRAEQNRPNSKYGELINTYIKEGKIVPMEITIALLHAAMKEAKSSRFLIDGFPRKMDQALKFEEAVVKSKFVLYFECPEEEMLKRLLKRGETSGRVDDNIESIKKRFRVFEDTSYPVIEHYQDQGKVQKVSCKQPIASVYAQTKDVIEKELHL